jgi:Ca2+-binding EF-hand superfamily protein
MSYERVHEDVEMFGQCSAESGSPVPSQKRQCHHIGMMTLGLLLALFVVISLFTKPRKPIMMQNAQRKSELFEDILQEAAYRFAFNSWDLDHDGTVNREDIVNWLAQMNVTASTDGFENAVEVYMNAYGNLTFEQYVLKYGHADATDPTHEVYRAEFNNWDLDNDGTISQNDVVNFLSVRNVTEDSNGFNNILKFYMDEYVNMTFEQFVAKQVLSVPQTTDPTQEAYRADFNNWDLDNDGTISQNDVVNFLSVRNVTEDSDGFNNILKFYMDEYGNMTFEQFVAKQVLSVPQTPHQMKEVYTAYFNTRDLDNDGTISQSDAVNFLAIRNVTKGSDGFENALELYMAAYGNLTLDQFAAKYYPGVTETASHNISSA